MSCVEAGCQAAAWQKIEQHGSLKDLVHTGLHLPQEKSLPSNSVLHQGKTLNTNSQGSLVIQSAGRFVGSLLVTSVSATEKRPHLPGSLLSVRLCAETGISQVVPDIARFKDTKKVIEGGKMIPTSPSILETIHTKIFLVVNFSGGQNYTTPEPVLL
jgi:hypothetical protein